MHKYVSKIWHDSIFAEKLQEILKISGAFYNNFLSNEQTRHRNEKIYFFDSRYNAQSRVKIWSQFDFKVRLLSC